MQKVYSICGKWNINLNAIKQYIEYSCKKNQCESDILHNIAKYINIQTSHLDENQCLVGNKCNMHIPLLLCLILLKEIVLCTPPWISVLVFHSFCSKSEPVTKLDSENNPVYKSTQRLYSSPLHCTVLHCPAL